jgi:DNA-binding transcriptional LysR family regulator
MVPTEKGKILYNYILDSMKKLEEGEQHFKRTQNERPTISVGMCFETFQYTLETYLELPLI